MRLLIMLTQPHVPTIAPPELRTRSSTRTPIPVPAPPPDSELLLYLNPLYLSIQPNLIIASYPLLHFTCVLLRLIAFLFLRSLSAFNSLRLILRPPTSSQTPAPDLCPEIIGHTASRTSGRNI